MNDKGRFTLVFMAPPGQPDCPVELTYNWDGDEGLPSRTAAISGTSPMTSRTSTTCARICRRMAW